MTPSSPYSGFHDMSSCSRISASLRQSAMGLTATPLLNAFSNSSTTRAM